MSQLPQTIAAAGAALSSGAISAEELTVALLEEGERRDGDLGAFLTRRPRADVLAEARAADERRHANAVLGPLDGIAIAHKDNIVTGGVRTTAGSPILDQWVPEHDATVVRRLSAAGTVMLGKLKNYEFAHSAIDNVHYGRTKHPLDPDRVTGGSSSGSAAAVAAGLCYAATGTDTGGSIRIPAAFTGIVGLKPTSGLVNRNGIVPSSWSLDTVGPMARTAADTALLLAAMEGPDDADPESSPAGRSTPFSSRSDLRGIRFGVATGYFAEGLDEPVAAAFAATLDRVSRLGGVVVEVSLPSASRSIAAEKAIVYPEATAAHEERLIAHFDQYGSRLRRSLLSGYYFTAVDYIRAQSLRRRLTAEMETALTLADVIATPTTPLVAPRYADTAADAAGSSELLHRYIRFLVIPNLTGHPAVSIPCGTDDSGMPIGLQLIGSSFDDGNLLSIAGALEVLPAKLTPEAS